MKPMDYNRFVERMRTVYPEHRKLFDIVEKENAAFAVSARSIEESASKKYKIVAGDMSKNEEVVNV